MHQVHVLPCVHECKIGIVYKDCVMEYIDFFTVDKSEIPGFPRMLKHKGSRTSCSTEAIGRYIYCTDIPPQYALALNALLAPPRRVGSSALVLVHF